MGGEHIHKQILSKVDGFEFGESCNPFEADWDEILIQIPYVFKDSFKTYAARIFSGELYFSIMSASCSKNPKLCLDFIIEPEYFRDTPKSMQRPKLGRPEVSWIPTPAQQLQAVENSYSCKLINR